MIFPSFYPGNLTGTWLGNQFTLDQAITVLRIAAVAKTATAASCPAAVFRLSNGTKGQDLVLTPGQNWSDTGAMVMTFNVGDVLQASLRTGSTCTANTGADANLLVEYKMQAQGDTDACSGTSCNGFCTSTSGDPSNCGTCGTACPSGQACTNGACPGGCTGGQVFCNGACTNTQTDNNNCGTCGNLCKSGYSFCSAGACVPLLQNGSTCTSSSQCLGGACTGGVCANSCPAGQTLCGSTCVNLQNDPNNCGFCNDVCKPNNDTPACVSGACSVLSCSPGFANCNNNAIDGCEVNTTNDPNNCGGCGIACISGQSCTNSACVGSPIGGPCSSNAACASNICDFVTSTCVGNLCVDQRKDGAETDIDCGGGTCATCAVGQSCLNNSDCTSNACDAFLLKCVASQCSDHKQDGSETDTDCGGPNSCARCNVGQKCIVASDCASGHFCNPLNVCQ